MIIIEFFFIDYHRNIFKSDAGLIKKGQFPLAFVENAQRFVFLKYLLIKIYLF